MWLHYSKHEVVLSELYNREQEGLYTEYSKPNGFWITDDTEDNWKSWCKGESFCVDRLEKCYEITLDEPSILFLRSVEDIDAFTKRYSTAPDLLRRFRRPVINWTEIAAKHKGLVITPYQWSRRMGHDTCWYYGWDCASGCIWDVSAIENIRILEEAMT